VTTPFDDAVVTAAEVDKLLRSLEAVPRHLASLIAGLDDARLRRRPRIDAWSANDVLAHLRACADVWGGSIATMIERDHPTPRYVSPRTWIRKTSYPELAFQPSLEAYAAQRDDLVRSLRSLAIGDWARGATFTGTTRGRAATILGYVRRIVAHEREHLEQIEATLRAP
jgi:hypothetical protein